MIDFQELYLEGFCSVKRLNFKLDQQGLNVIQARNGTGKTTIFSGLSWVLFGRTLKNKSTVNTWKHLQGEDYKGTKGQLEFTKDGIIHIIIRCEDYKGKVQGHKGKDRLILFTQGLNADELIERTDLRNKNEVQKEINTLLGFSYDLFINSVIFGQKLKRIIQETGPRKKEVFEEAFEVSYINTAKKIALEKKAKYEEKLSDISPLIVKFETEVRLYKGQLKEAEGAKKYFETQKAIDLKICRNMIKGEKAKGKEYDADAVLGLVRTKTALLSTLAELKRFEKTRDEVEKKHFQIEMLLTQNKGKIKEFKNLIEQLKGVYHQPKICRVCGSIIPKEKRLKEKKKIEKEMAQATGNKILSENRVKANQNDLDELEKMISSMLNIETELESNNNKIKELDIALNIQENYRQQQLSTHKNLKTLRKRLKAVKAKKFSTDLDKLTTQYQEAKSNLKPLLDDAEQINKKLETYTWLIKVPLSNSGMKAFIFEYMIGLVNEKLDEYSRIIGFKVNFGIDMDSHKRDFYSTVIKNGNHIPYGELSGGEQQLVDVVTAFAVHDTVSLEKNVNLIVMDECFESLDEENIEIVTELLQQKAETKSVWLITHLKGFSSSNCKITYLAKSKKGFTKVLQA